MKKSLLLLFLLTTIFSLVACDTVETTSVGFANETLTLEVGDSATLELDNPRDLALSELTFASEDEAVVTVTSTGGVIAEGEGITAVTLTYEEVIVDFVLVSVFDPDSVAVDGREVVMRVANNYVQWSYEGSDDWTDLISLFALTGADGNDGADGQDGQTGTDGREVEFQTTATDIEWRYVGDETWTVLLPLTLITGANGQDGQDGQDGVSVVDIYINEPESLGNYLSFDAGRYLDETNVDGTIDTQDIYPDWAESYYVEYSGYGIGDAGNTLDTGNTYGYEFYKIYGTLSDDLNFGITYIDQEFVDVEIRVTYDLTYEDLDAVMYTPDTADEYYTISLTTYAAYGDGAITVPAGATNVFVEMEVIGDNTYDVDLGYYILESLEDDDLVDGYFQEFFMITPGNYDSVYNFFGYGWDDEDFTDYSITLYTPLGVIARGTCESGPLTVGAPFMLSGDITLDSCPGANTTLSISGELDMPILVLFETNDPSVDAYVTYEIADALIEFTFNNNRGVENIEIAQLTSLNYGSESTLTFELSDATTIEIPFSDLFDLSDLEAAIATIEDELLLQEMINFQALYLDFIEVSSNLFSYREMILYNDVDPYSSDVFDLAGQLAINFFTMIELDGELSYDEVLFNPFYEDSNLEGDVDLITLLNDILYADITPYTEGFFSAGEAYTILMDISRFIDEYMSNSFFQYLANYPLTNWGVESYNGDFMQMLARGLLPVDVTLVVDPQDDGITFSTDESVNQINWAQNGYLDEFNFNTVFLDYARLELFRDYENARMNNEVYEFTAAPGSNTASFVTLLGEVFSLPGQSYFDVEVDGSLYRLLGWYRAYDPTNPLFVDTDGFISPVNTYYDPLDLYSYDNTYNNDLQFDNTLTLYARWVEVFEVTFLDFDDTVLKTETVLEGESATAPADPSRVGYNFVGWEPSFDNITGHTTVYAGYSAIDYNITYDFNGVAGVTNDELNPDTYTIEDAVTFNDPNVPVGYTFYGWYEDASFTTPASDIVVGTTGDITLYADIRIDTFTVDFYDLPEGTLLDTQTIDYGSDATAPTAPTREGYTFIGWDTDFTNVTEDLTVTATWRAINYAVEIVIEGPDNPTWTTAGRPNIGQTFTITPTANPGYSISSVVVTYLPEGATEPVELTVTLSGGEYTFTMPADDVVVTITTQESPSVNVSYRLTYSTGLGMSTPTDLQTTFTASGLEALIDAQVLDSGRANTAAEYLSNTGSLGFEVYFFEDGNTEPIETALIYNVPANGTVDYTQILDALNVEVLGNISYAIIEIWFYSAG